MAELTRLLRRSIDETPPHRGGSLLGRPARSVDPVTRLTTAFDNTASLVAAGTIDGVVVGVALTTVDNDLATIEELYVEPEARGVGVGEALVDFSVTWARERGAAAMDYAALPGDRETKSLGERSGFSARLIVMHRRL